LAKHSEHSSTLPQKSQDLILCKEALSDQYMPQVSTQALLGFLNDNELISAYQSSVDQLLTDIIQYLINRLSHDTPILLMIPTGFLQVNLILAPPSSM